MNRMSEQGLRVLSIAVRPLDDSQEAQMRDDPMQLVEDLVFVGLVGIIGLRIL